MNILCGTELCIPIIILFTSKQAATFALFNREQLDQEYEK
jgi:hypothetical protein